MRVVKTWWPWLVCVALWVVAICLFSCDRGLKKEIEQLRQELARQQQYVPLQRGTIRDTED